MLIVKKQATDRVRLCCPCPCCHFSPLFAHLLRRHTQQLHSEVGLLATQGTEVLFATIINVPLNFTEACEKLGGQRESDEWEAWAS